MFKNRLFIALRTLSIVACSMVFSYDASRSEKTKEASNRIIYLIQEQPARYSPQAIEQDFDYLNSLTTNPDKQAILQEILWYINAYFACTSNNGQRISTHMECEWVDETTCAEDIGGIFQSCASACRHLQVDICTLECVPVCNL